MNAIQPASFYEFFDYHRNLQHKIAATQHTVETDKSIDTLRRLSEDLRAFSEINRNYAKAVRQRSSLTRAAVETTLQTAQRLQNPAQ